MATLPGQPQAPLNILCSTDLNYVPYCGIMLTSLFESNPHSRFRVFVLTQELPDDGRAQLRAIADRYGSEICFVNVDIRHIEASLEATLSNTTRLSMASYLRLLITDALPADVGRILYLDCDMCVAGDIRPLYSESFRGSALLAVPDQDHFLKADFSHRLGIPPEATYFNAGMLLIDLEWWRSHDVERAFLDFIAAHPTTLNCHDQDVLNGVLATAARTVDVRYNFQTGFLYVTHQPKYSEAFRGDIRRALGSSPVILHYTGSSKPWLAASRHPLNHIYRRYQRLSPWPEPAKGPRPSLYVRLKQLAMRVLRMTGIVKWPRLYIIDGRRG